MTHPVRLAAIEEVLCAYRAGGKIAALVRCKLCEMHAAVALHAVAGVQAQARSPSAQIAVRAVVDLRHIAEAAIFHTCSVTRNVSSDEYQHVFTHFAR